MKAHLISAYGSVALMCIMLGYRMIHDVLRPQYPHINHKRVYRLYTAEGLSIRKRKKTKRIGVRVPLVAALAVNQTWEAWTL